MHRTAILVGLLLAVACSGGNPVNTSGGGEAAADTVAFFNSYQTDPAVLLGSRERFRVLKTAGGEIAVDYVDPAAPASGSNLFTLTLAGAAVDSGASLGYGGLDDVPEAWFGAQFNSLARTPSGGYLKVQQSGLKVQVVEYGAGGPPAGGPVDTTEIFDLTTSDLADQGYSVDLWSPTPIVRTFSGYVTGIWLDATPATAFATRIRLIWLDESLSVVGTADHDKSFPAERLVLLAASDGGIVVGTEIVAGSYPCVVGTCTDADAYLFKFTSARTFQWESTTEWRTDKREEFIRIVEAPTGNYFAVAIIQGTSQYNAGFDAGENSARIVELSPFGGVIRTARLPVPVHQVWDIAPQANGKFLVSGTLFSTFYQEAALFIANLDAGFLFTESNVTP